MKKLESSHVKNFVESIGYKLISEYKTNRDTMILLDKNNYILTASYSNLRKGKSPDKFSKFNRYSIINIKKYLLDNDIQVNLLSRNYCNAIDKLVWKCLNCNSYFKMNWNHFKSGKRCPYCSGHKVNHTNNIIKTHPNLMNAWDFDKNQNKHNPYLLSSGSNYEVWWKCENNHSYKQRIINACNGIGCRICSESKGEKKIRSYLTVNQIEFIAQKEFNDLLGIGGRNLSFDFYIPKFNLLIEYQGEFHDGNGNYFMKQNIERISNHDARKKAYCEKEGINLLEIWYWNFDNIEELLNECFKKKENE